MRGRVPESRRFVLGVFRNWDGFPGFALIPEGTNVVANLDALGGAEVDVHDGTLTRSLNVVYTRNNQSNRLAAHRGEMVKCPVLDGRSRTVLVGTDNVASLHVRARETHFGDGNFGLNVDDAKLPDILIEQAH